MTPKITSQRSKTPLEQEIAGLTERRLFEQERLIVQVTGELLETMKETKVTQARIAQRLDVTRSAVSQWLDGSRNLTLRTLADLGLAIGRRIGITLEPAEMVEFRDIVLDTPVQVRRPSEYMIDEAILKVLFGEDEDQAAQTSTTTEMQAIAA